MRQISVAVNNLMERDRLVLAILVEINIPQPVGPMRFANTAHTIKWNNLEWQGAGALLSLEPPEEDASLEAHKGVIRLNGLDATILSFGLWAGLNFAPISIWTAFYNPDTYQPVDAVLFFRGTVGQVRGVPITEAEGE